MNFFVVFFLPCVFGLYIYYLFIKEKNVFDVLTIYLMNVLFTNICNMVVLFLKDSKIYSLTNRIDGDFRFALKYILISVLFSFIVGVVFAVVKKYFKLSLEVKNGKKK